MAHISNELALVDLATELVRTLWWHHRYRLQHRQWSYWSSCWTCWWHSFKYNGFQWCWWHRYVGDCMMMTDFRCWWQNHYVDDFESVNFESVDFESDLNRSPTSQTCHQHICFPTFVTNIDVTIFKVKW